MTDPQKQDNGKRLLMQYAGMATQLVVSLGVGVFIGYWIDKMASLPVAIFTWLLPLLILIALFIKVFKDTSRKK
jgi:F0F1-type ATP synthase assembly protein I